MRMSLLGILQQRMATNFDDGMKMVMIMRMVVMMMMMMMMKVNAEMLRKI